MAKRSVHSTTVRIEIDAPNNTGLAAEFEADRSAAMERFRALACAAFGVPESFVRVEVEQQVLGPRPKNAAAA